MGPSVLGRPGERNANASARKLDAGVTAGRASVDWTEVP
jgi:hypothetical protein